MANDIIDIVVSKKAVDEVYQLDTALQQTYKSFLQFYELSLKAGKVPTASNSTPKARKQLTEMEKAMKALETTEKKLAIAKSDVNKKLIEQRELLRVTNLQTKQAAVENNKLLGAYANMGARLARLRREYKDVAAAQGVSSSAARKLAGEVVNLDNKMKKIDASVGQFQRNVGNYSSAFKGLGRNLRSLAGAFGFAGGVYLFANAIRDSFNRVREFDKAMQNIAGVMRTTRVDIKDLEREVINVAGSSVKTSREVAKLAENLVTLGKTKKEVKDLLKPVVDLSIGLEASADEAGEFLIQMLNTFGASTDEASTYADTIATIRTSTTLDFQKMRDSFGYLAPISKALNKDLAYTGSLVGILADNGIKAERAGRLLGTAQQKLAASGKTLDDALGEINAKIKSGASDIDVLALSSQLLGKQSAALGLVLAANTDKIDKQAEAIRNNTGALKDLTDSQLESLDAKIKILDSTWEKFILSIEDGNGSISRFIKKSIEGVTGLIEALSYFNEDEEEKELQSNEKGLNQGKAFINQTVNGKVFGRRMSEENQLKAIEEERLLSIQKMNQEYKFQEIIKAKLVKAEKELEETQSNASVFALGDALGLEQRSAVSAFEEALAKSNEKLAFQTGVLEAISNYELKDTEIEAAVTDKEVNERVLADAKENAAKRNQLLKDSFALKKYLLEQEIELNDEIASDEEEQYDGRIQALNNFQDKSETLLELERDEELRQVGLSSDAKKLIWEKYYDEVEDLHKEFYDRLNEISVLDEDSGLPQEVIQGPTFEDSIMSFADFFGFDPDLMLKEWEQYVKEMEEIGEEATLNGFNERLISSTKKLNEEIKDLAEKTGEELVNITNNVFDAKIQRIDDEINRNNDFYAELLDNELLSEEQRSALEAEREAKEAQLNKRKREEQRKQAIFNKIISVAQIGIQTAMAAAAALAPPPVGLGPVLGGTLLPYILGFGALQAATVLSTPIPAYKKGKERGEGKDGIALLNDGGRDEVIVSSDGTARQIKGRNVFENILQEDKIYPSVSAFNQDMSNLLNQNAISSSRVIVQSKSKKQDNKQLERSIETAIKKGFRNAKVTNIQNFKSNDMNDYIRSKMH